MLRNHNTSDKSFDIYMLNKVPVAGFQCDLPGININSATGGLLENHDYNTSNSKERLLSFSMKAVMIPPGEGVLTKISYSQVSELICMDKIIFASKAGEELSTNYPECIN